MRGSVGNKTKHLGKSLAVIGPMMLAPVVANAEDFTAGVVMKKMNSDARFFFLSGVVEGLAYARYVKDGNKTEGMGCITDWFYKNEKTLPKIQSAFERFPDHTPGAIMAALVEKECGA